MSTTNLSIFSVGLSILSLAWLVAGEFTGHAQAGFALSVATLAIAGIFVLNVSSQVGREEQGGPSTGNMRKDA